tara:strand:+ start:850 stop:1038 length:189 start_codon:yes stop_codon:yes gene_type:complete
MALESYRAFILKLSISSDSQLHEMQMIAESQGRWYRGYPKSRIAEKMMVPGRMTEEIANALE